MDSLSTQQQQLVSDHLHMVESQVRSYVAPARSTRREREGDDLYQEGCLGLIRAAKRYDPSSDIPFGAYAKRRIHRAMSEALYEHFSILRIPMKAQTKALRSQDPSIAAIPRVVSLEYDPPTRPSAAKSDPSGAVLVGDHIRHRFESAAQKVREEAKQSPGRRGDRAELVDRIMDERLLIPDECGKASLRQIARETRSSYARVAACEKKLISRIREELQADAGFCHLRRRARKSAGGFDELLEESGTDLAADRFRDATSALSSEQLGLMLWRLVQTSGGDPHVLLRRLFAKLPQDQQESIREELATPRRMT